MRILFLIHRPQARGQEIFAAQLGNQFLELGHEVLLLSLYWGDFDLSFKGRHIRFNLNHGIETIFPWSWKRLAAVIQDFKPEIIQANGGDTVKFLALTKLVSPISGKLVFNNGGVVGYYLSSAWKRWIYRKLLTPWDGVISVSQHTQLDLAKFLPENCKQTHIPIGIPDQDFQLPYGPDFQVFVHIGGFTAEKNHFELIRFFADYVKQEPTAQLWLIGEGPLKVEAELLADQFAPNSIRFFGAVSNPWTLVPQNSILVLPSKIEGMPAVVAESILAKIPVVAYAVGGIPEMASGISTITLVEPGEEASFLSAMAYWTKVPRESLRADLEASALKVKERFDLEKVSSRFLEFYKLLCE